MGSNDHNTKSSCCETNVPDSSSEKKTLLIWDTSKNKIGCKIMIWKDPKRLILTSRYNNVHNRISCVCKYSRDGPRIILSSNRSFLRKMQKSKAAWSSKCLEYVYESRTMVQSYLLEDGTWSSGMLPGFQASSVLLLTGFDYSSPSGDRIGSTVWNNAGANIVCENDWIKSRLLVGTTVILVIYSFCKNNSLENFLIFIETIITIYHSFNRHLYGVVPQSIYIT